MTSDGIILAAGRSTRMKSQLSKVLHPAAGRPLVHFPVRALLEAGVDRTVVVCNAENLEPVRDSLVSTFGSHRIECVVQPKPLGTGDATRIGLGAVQSRSVFVACGDTPLLEAEDLNQLRATVHAEQAVLGVSSCILADPGGYGRIVRGPQGDVLAIREHKDATPAERELREVNSGVYFGQVETLMQAIGQLSTHNQAQELYLTDVVEILGRRHRLVAAVGRADTLLGVNDRAQLAEADRLLCERIRLRWQRAGVTVHPSARVDDTVQLEADTTIESGVVLRGQTVIGRACRIDVGCVLSDVQIGEGAELSPYCVVNGGRIASGTVLAPFTRSGTSDT